MPQCWSPSLWFLGLEICRALWGKAGTVWSLEKWGQKQCCLVAEALPMCRQQLWLLFCTGRGTKLDNQKKTGQGKKCVEENIALKQLFHYFSLTISTLFFANGSHFFLALSIQNMGISSVMVFSTILVTAIFFSIYSSSKNISIALKSPKAFSFLVS